MILGRLSQTLLTFQSVFTSRASLHTSAVTASWGGGKLKTHTGVAKRFKPVGRRRGTAKREDIELFSDDTEFGGSLFSYAPTKALGTMFKRGQTGKRHLNSKMSHTQAARLRGTKIHQSGHTIRTLNRLLGTHY